MGVSVAVCFLAEPANTEVFAYYGQTEEGKQDDGLVG